MRKSLTIACAVSLWLLSLPVAGPSAADEIFFCEDGRTLQLNASNRQKLMQDPCIKSWFENNQTAAQLRAAAEKKKAESGPQTMVGIAPDASGGPGGGGGGVNPLLPFLFGFGR